MKRGRPKILSHEDFTTLSAYMEYDLQAIHDLQAIPKSAGTFPDGCAGVWELGYASCLRAYIGEVKKIESNGGKWNDPKPRPEA